VSDPKAVEYFASFVRARIGELEAVEASNDRRLAAAASSVIWTAVHSVADALRELGLLSDPDGTSEVAMLRQRLIDDGYMTPISVGAGVSDRMAVASSESPLPPERSDAFAEFHVAVRDLEGRATSSNYRVEGLDGVGAVDVAIRELERIRTELRRS